MALRNQCGQAQGFLIRRASYKTTAVFEDLGLVVRWGVEVGIAEAQCVYAVHRFLDGRVPVPEVYGWRTDGDEKSIYMQYVHGQALEEAWDTTQSAVSSGQYANLRQLERIYTSVGVNALSPLYWHITFSVSICALPSFPFPHHFK